MSQHYIYLYYLYIYFYINIYGYLYIYIYYIFIYGYKFEKNLSTLTGFCFVFGNGGSFKDDLKFLLCICLFYKLL